MNRTLTIQSLKFFDDTWLHHMAEGMLLRTPYDPGVSKRFLNFVEDNPDCFERSNLRAHITGSAFVLNKKLNRTLLTLHKKLNLWLQLGGHCDGHPLVHEVALREAQEESGLKGLKFLSYEKALFGVEPSTPIPFDLDCHRIPSHKKEPAHYHFDIRYLLVAENEDYVVSEESAELRWFTLNQAFRITDEPSMRRQFQKWELISSHLAS